MLSRFERYRLLTRLRREIRVQRGRYVEWYRTARTHDLRYSGKSNIHGDGAKERVSGRNLDVTHLEISLRVMQRFLLES